MHAPPFKKASIPTPPPLDSFPILPAALAEIPGYASYNPPNPQVAVLDPLSSPPGGEDDCSVPRIHPFERDIDEFRTVIDYRRYSLTNRVTHIDTEDDLSLLKLERKVELLYYTLELFSGKVPMDLLCFLSTMTEAFNAQRLSQDIASRAIGFFLTFSAHTAYKNITHHGTYDLTLFLVTWSLIVL